MLTFTITLPALPPEPNDIASGELTLSINGVSQVVTTTKNQTEVAGLTGDQGETVDASFVYVDDAGNKSQSPSLLSVVLADTLPPPNAGDLGLTITAET